jgi:hypothetical protein
MAAYICRVEASVCFVGGSRQVLNPTKKSTGVDCVSIKTWCILFETCHLHDIDRVVGQAVERGEEGGLTWDELDVLSGFHVRVFATPRDYGALPVGLAIDTRK